MPYVIFKYPKKLKDSDYSDSSREEKKKKKKKKKKEAKKRID